MFFATGSGLFGAVGGNILGGTEPLVEPVAFDLRDDGRSVIDNHRLRVGASNLRLECGNFIISRLKKIEEKKIEKKRIRNVVVFLFVAL